MLRRRVIPPDAGPGGKAVLADPLQMKHAMLGDARSLGIEPAPWVSALRRLWMRRE